MSVYSLGAALFIEANVDVPGGAPPLPAENVEIIPPFPGIDGIAVRNVGRSGMPFPFRTCAYTTPATVAAAATLYQTYTLFRGQAPQNLVWEGVDYDNASVRFIVQDVGQFQVRMAKSLIVNGTVIGSAALVYATWTLLPVDM
jgi:hypothetical protein